jgi:hypothetical protein
MYIGLWDRFCRPYDDSGSKLIHRLVTLDHARTDRAITACRDVSRWLDAIA